MSGKTTLLTSIPPAQEAESKSDGTSLLSPIPAKVKNEAEVSKVSKGGSSLLSPVAVKRKAQNTGEGDTKGSLLSQAGATESLLQPIDSVVQSVRDKSEGTDGISGEKMAASESVTGSPDPITTFQMVTYTSFVLNFLLAGAAAVILFKKVGKLAERRFAVSTKTLAIASVLIMLHGFFATYLYAAHLSSTVSSAPLFLTMAVWVFVGPAVGFVIRNLLARKNKPNRKAAFVDAGIYGLIFFLTACGVSSGIKTNAALLSSIMAGFLMIVPIARSLSVFNVAKARHKELNDTSEQVLIYGLLLLPALLPVLAFAHVCGLSDALTLFLINFITFDFVLVVGLSMVIAADELIPEQAAEAVETETQTVERVEKVPAAAPTDTADPKESPVVEPQPEKVLAGNPDDPIIQFLNSEVDAEEPSATSQAGASKANPSRLPPRKPGSPKVAPPPKPGSVAAKKAPNAPAHIKAPPKPKKRF